MAGLLLGELPVQAASNEGDDQSVGAHALLGRSPLDLLQHVRREFDLLFRSLSHLHHHTASCMVSATKKQGSRRANVQPSYSRSVIR